MAAFISVAKLVQLLNTADAGKGLYAQIIDSSGSNVLALGATPLQPTLLIDFSKESAEPYDRAGATRNAAPGIGSPQAAPQRAVPAPPGSRVTRSSGDYWFEVSGRRIECNSLKDLLCKALCTLEGIRPGTVENLSHVKPRSRRIVARHPKDLFARQHLAEKFSEQLMHGWWYGTNNSRNETNAWLERACRCADLRWGNDFRTSLMMPSDGH